MEIYFFIKLNLKRWKKEFPWTGRTSFQSMVLLTLENPKLSQNLWPLNRDILLKVFPTNFSNTPLSQLTNSSKLLILLSKRCQISHQFLDQFSAKRNFSAPPQFLENWHVYEDRMWRSPRDWISGKVWEISWFWVANSWWWASKSSLIGKKANFSKFSPWFEFPKKFIGKRRFRAPKTFKIEGIRALPTSFH